MSRGRFVWHDMMSTDAERAKAFYTELFGWTAEPMDMGGMGVYHVFANREREFGGIMPPGPAYGLRSHWIPYIDCDDVDADAARAAELGGTIAYPPHDIPDVGRFSVIGDPQGTHFHLFRPNPRPDADPQPESQGIAPGGVSWNELLTGDSKDAIRFYTELFGWTAEDSGMPGVEYTLLKREGTLVAGLMQKSAGMPVSAWGVYFEVGDSVDRTVADVARLGGSILMPPMDVPGVGRMASASDPAGGAFSMMKSAPMPSAATADERETAGIA